MILIERAWAMPNKWTFTILPIKNLLEEELKIYDMKETDIVIDPFAGMNSPANLTNDLNPEMDAACHMDALNFLKHMNSNCASCILFDPPYSPRQIAESYKSVGLDTNGGEKTRSSFYSHIKNEIARIVKPGGKVISFGWNTNGIGKTRGFELKRILIVAHGGAHNDTLVTVEIKR